VTHHRIEVELGDRSYPVYVGSGVGSSFAPTCRQHRVPERIVVVSDTNVARRYLTPLLKHLRHFQFDASSVVIPPGERQKSLNRANRIYSAMLKAGVRRNAAVVALGGGVVGDLAGFVAATYQRGIQLVHVPTTLLAQVDSSIGGKVAVNHPLGKNMIGAFYQPVLVWTDVDYLRTLPMREVVCGMGEIIKYGVISDAELFTYVEANLSRLLALDRESVLHVQARCCGIKADVTSKDEKETGLRMILNYGHTVGHALEAAGEYRTIKHGEAVLLGMVAESYIAMHLGLIDAATHQRVKSLVDRIPLRPRIAAVKRSDILRAMGRDKKAVGTKKRFVLPTRIGEVRVVEDVDTRLVLESLNQILPAQRRTSAA
jgi:3-dehydroquinate synthase